MISKNIQPDYGLFDFKFLGISLRFHANYLSWKRFLEIIEKSEDPEEIVDLGNAALLGDPLEAFDTFTLGTVLDHEKRHFDDFILSPYENSVFRSRLKSLLHGYQALVFLGRENGFPRGKKRFPVPLSRWVKMKPLERTRWLSQMKKMRKSVESFELSSKVESFIQATNNNYIQIEELLINSKSNSESFHLQPYHLFEASAVITQIQRVYSIFGVKHAELFINLLLNSSGNSLYSKVLLMLFSLLDNGDFPNFALMSSIVTWSLLGNYLTDKWNACPTVRFTKLFKLLQAEGLPLDTKSWSELFQEWTEKLCLSPVEVAFEKNMILNENFLNWLKSLPEQSILSEAIPLIKCVEEVMETLYNANLYMTKVFSGSLDSYVDPYLYSENTENWVAAPVAVNFVGGGLRASKTMFKNCNIHKAFENEDEYLIFRLAFPDKTEGVDLFDTDTALEAADYMTMNDFYFAESRRDDPDFDMVRQELGDDPLEILF